jgi:hypothetical protein
MIGTIFRPGFADFGMGSDSGTGCVFAKNGRPTTGVDVAIQVLNRMRELGRSISVRFT